MDSGRIIQNLGPNQELWSWKAAMWQWLYYCLLNIYPGSISVTHKWCKCFLVTNSPAIKHGTSSRPVAFWMRLRVAHILLSTLVKGSSSRPLSRNLSLIRMRPPSLDRSRSSRASPSSEPYNWPASRNDVRVLICSRTRGTPPNMYAPFPEPQAGAERNTGRQLLGPEGRRGSSLGT